MCVSECDLNSSTMRRPGPQLDCCATKDVEIGNGRFLLNVSLLTKQNIFLPKSFITGIIMSKYLDGVLISP